MAKKKKTTSQTKKSAPSKKECGKSCNKKVCNNIPTPPPVPPAPTDSMSVKDALKVIKDRVFASFSSWYK